MFDSADLSTEEFASLLKIGMGLRPGAEPIPFPHLGALLRLSYIRAEIDSYEPTASGLFRIANGR
jgi:hypothetical protein